MLRRLEEEKKKNPALLHNSKLQLDWVYRNSKYYEKTHMRYPVGRLISPAKIQFK